MPASHADCHSYCSSICLEDCLHAKWQHHSHVVPQKQAASCIRSPHAGALLCRLSEDVQLEDWTRLSGLTGLTLRGVRDSHHGTLAAVLPRLTALRSLALVDGSQSGLPEAGEHCCSDSVTLSALVCVLGSGVPILDASQLACTCNTIEGLLHDSCKHHCSSCAGWQTCRCS